MKLSLSLLALAVAPLCVGGLSAVVFEPTGPRSLGMGGASVAVANDSLAALHNPAFLATAPRTKENKETGEEEMAGRYGWNVVDMSAGVTLSGQIGDYLDTLSDVNLNQLTDGDISETDARNLLRLTSSLSSVDDPGNGLVFKAGAGTAVRWGNVSVGARMRAHGAVRVDSIDTTNIGLDGIANTAALNTDLDAARGATTPTGSTLSQGQKDSLTGTGISATNVDYLDSLLTDLINSGQINSSDVAATVELLTNVANNLGSGNSLDDNTTVVTARAIGIGEIPIAYGYEVTPGQHRRTLRLMMGRVYGTTLLVFADNNDEYVDDIDSSYETSFNATLDLGLRYEYGKLTLAAVGRNLTAPKFDGFTTTTGAKIDDVQLDPQVTLGVAYELLPRLTLTAEGDVLESESLLRGLDEQYLRAGIEWDPIRSRTARRGL